MFYDLFWKIKRPFVALLRWFDHDIIASNMWRVQVKRLTNCSVLPDKDILVMTQADFVCCHPTYKPGIHETAISEPKDISSIKRARYLGGRSKARVTLKVHIPFKCHSASFKLSLATRRLRCETTIDVDSLAAGIHYIEIFPSELDRFVQLLGDRK